MPTSNFMNIGIYIVKPKGKHLRIIYEPKDQAKIMENIDFPKNDGLFHISKLAIEAFIEDVKNGKFPSDQFSYKNNWMIFWEEINESKQKMVWAN